MNVRSRALRAILCCSAAGLLLAGCGGGGGGGDPIEPTGTALAIGADAAFSEARASSRVGQELGAPLESGARVAIYDFATRQEIASGQTGPDGFWRSNLTAGLTAVVVITGSNAGKTYRLSAIIPVVPIGEGDTSRTRRPRSRRRRSRRSTSGGPRSTSRRSTASSMKPARASERTAGRIGRSPGDSFAEPSSARRDPWMPTASGS